LYGIQTDGNVILQTAETVEGLLIALFLTSNSVRKFEMLPEFRRLARSAPDPFGSVGTSMAGPGCAASTADTLAAARAAYERHDFKTEAKLLRPLAEQGNATAQTLLGFMYGHGQGLPENAAEALKWYRKAAEQGDVGAQSNLGLLYEQGRGTPQDFDEAIKWFRKAADQGLAFAQNNLGAMYARGLAVAQDYAQAAKWYRKAAEQGYPVAQCNLGRRYTNGQGVPQDDAEALNWYRKAAEQGDAPAQFSLGYAYMVGDGVTKDYVQAYMWLNLAVAGGVKAEDIRDHLKRLISPTQLSETQQLIAAWRPVPSGEFAPPLWPE
jgi:TPR repeat protein